MAEEKKTLTSKEMKKLVKPEFAKNFETVYPVATLRKLGFSRHSCACGHNYWSASADRKTCGDSNCEMKYKFIGVGTGLGKAGKKITYAEAWNGFKKSLTSARIPCTAIPRYPVVARWRTDVEFVNAGIYCFQPYCVTGELDPPANPLICPQFCVRFNDLDNIGLTGRHYSGFIMLGIQVFNKPNARKFWMEECVEFNYRWLTEELKIDPAEITFIEDVWAGGGNLGPSIEYFVGGLELGNMVFMQYKTFPDGSRKPLDVQVIDVGIGLERVPWLVNGTPTSYEDIFPTAIKLFNSKITMADAHSKVWEKFGPYSCLLNVDELDDVEKTWGEIAAKIGMKPMELKDAVQAVRDMYIVLDHTRSILMTITDGMLPSNTGGGSDIRNLLRRVFSILIKRGWWEPLGKIDGFLQFFDCHRTDLATIYGPFAPFPSFSDIVRLEFDRFTNTQAAQEEQCKKLLAKKKGKKFEIADWILCVGTFGMSIDLIQRVCGQPAPGDLYMRIAEEQERSAKQAVPQLYDCATLKPTESLFYKNDQAFEFEASIVKVLEYHKRAPAKKEAKDEDEEPELGVEGPSIVVVDKSSFYPTSGGQDHDTGVMTVEGKTYQVVDVQKVGPCVLHFLDAPLPVADLSHYTNMKITAKVNVERRKQLRIHHSATHIMYASCRKVLGPHVWQHGAKKQIDVAHLDVTHYDSISLKQRLEIEDMANSLVQSSKSIKKWYMPKEEAEKQFGFSLYQGGVVPGSELRIVQIADTDTEACCGTHCDNTSEVGFIKIIKSQRVSDGVLRIYFCAGAPALKMKTEDMTVLYNLCEEFNVPPTMLSDTVHRFFDGYKKSESSKAPQDILTLKVKCLLMDENTNSVILKSDAKDATDCISILPQFAKDLKAKGKSIVIVGESFVYGIVSGNVDVKKELEPLMKVTEEDKKPAKFKVDNKIKVGKDTVADVTAFSVFNAKNPTEVIKYFVETRQFKVSDY